MASSAHPTLAKVGREICTNSKSFLEEYRIRGCRLCMSLKVHRISSMNTSRKCVCPLHTCIWLLGVGALPQTPTRALTLDPAGELPSRRPSVPTLPPNPGYANEISKHAQELNYTSMSAMHRCTCA